MKKSHEKNSTYIHHKNHFTKARVLKKLPTSGTQIAKENNCLSKGTSWHLGSVVRSRGRKLKPVPTRKRRLSNLDDSNSLTKAGTAESKPAAAGRLGVAGCVRGSAELDACPKNFFPHLWTGDETAIDALRSECWKLRSAGKFELSKTCPRTGIFLFQCLNSVWVKGKI